MKRIKEFLPLHQLVLLCAFLLYSFTSSADNISFTAIAQKVVNQGERFRVTFQVNQKASSFKGPSFKGFSVLSGPNQSSSSSISVVNGNFTQSVTTSYSYIVVGNSPGKFSVPAASCVVDGKTYQSNSLNIEVVKGNSSSTAKNNAQANSRQNNRSAKSSLSVSDDDVFVRVIVDKKKVYLGEPIVATLKVYTKLSLADFKNYKFPSFKGFYSQAINEPDRISMERENVGGVVYETGLFKQVLLYPQQTGNIVIDPFELECVLRVKVARQSFFDPGYREVAKSVKSKPITIAVKSLPKPAPGSFNGAVGQFSFSVKADKTELEANDALTLVAKIQGKGNLKLIDELGIKFPSDFEVYDPKISNNFKNSTGGTKGSKSYEYLIIPRHSGTFQIPALAFTYFDPKRGKYTTLNSQEITISVAKGEGGSAGPAVIQGISKENVTYLGKDIRYIKTGDFELFSRSDYFFGSLPYYLLLIFPSLLFGGFVALRRKQIVDSQNIARTRNRKASKLTKKRLKLASQFLKSEKDNEFYEELVRALWGYLSDKLVIPLAELSKDRAKEELAGYEVSSELVDELVDILDSCEFARYAPSAVSKSKAEMLKQAESVLQRLDHSITVKA